MGDSGKLQLAKQEKEDEEIKRLLLGIMEGYNDTAIPPLSFFSPSPGISITEKGSSSRKRQKNEASWAESLLRERKRREQMNENFSLLPSMLPTLFNNYKPPKEKIIIETVNYIKYLEEERKRLESLKEFQWKEPELEKLVLSKCTTQNSSVKVTVSKGLICYLI